MAVNTAHLALERQPGRDVSMSPYIPAIASSAKKMMLTVRSVRNNDGAGHGRARVRPIEEETVTAIYDATVLWVRWALRRIEHILIGEADRLIAESRDAIVYQRSLTTHLEAVMLPDQPPTPSAPSGLLSALARRRTFAAPDLVGQQRSAAVRPTAGSRTDTTPTAPSRSKPEASRARSPRPGPP